jgi:hypothetical protein
MNIKITLTCSCGNTQTYNIGEAYHKPSHETFIDLTEAIYDNKFHAKPVPDGMWVNCRECRKGVEVI